MCLPDGAGGDAETIKAMCQAFPGLVLPKNLKKKRRRKVINILNDVFLGN